MRKIGIIAAMAPEMELILQSMEEVEKVTELGISFYDGFIGENEIILSLCGVGKVNAAMAATLLISQFGCDLLINTGIAGGVAPLKTGDVIIADSLMYHDFDTTIFGYEYGQVPQMPKEIKSNPVALLLVKSALSKLNIDYKCCKVYTGDKFVSSFEVLSNVDINDGAACEMEGAAIAHVAFKARVDFIVLRYISDIIGEESQIDNYLEFEGEMASRSAKITLQIVNNL
ncbi:MAG: 5'-methylthioadenosine/adenosylhomocysteine nucleosidase [Acholeplasmatales bacterium]|nr:5'-methylthioadenosine/adenosylhomocysteine nucleosidase [Acholeplasmatales bacterium]